jgi:hypothetical protein
MQLLVAFPKPVVQRTTFILKFEVPCGTTRGFVKPFTNDLQLTLMQLFVAFPKPVVQRTTFIFKFEARCGTPRTTRALLNAVQMTYSWL